MGREAVTGGVHAVSVLACGSAWSGVFTHLSKNVEGSKWGSVKTGHTRGGLSYCMEVTPTGPHSGQSVTPPVLPLRDKVLYAFSQSHQSLCMSIANSDSTGLSTDWTGMFKSSLCSGHEAWSWLSFLFFTGKSFHTTQRFPFPNHESAEQRSHQCRWLCLWN